MTPWRDGNLSDTLQQVDLPIVAQAACNAVYGRITVLMICAGYVQGGKDSCQGTAAAR